MLDAIELVFVEAERLDHEFIALDQFGCGKTHGNRRGLGVVFDEAADAVDTAVQRTVVGTRRVGRAEIDAPGALAVAGNVHRVLHELVDALVFSGGNGDDRHAEFAFELVDVDGAAIRRDLVHHVEGDDHGAVEFHELQRKIEVAFDVGGVDDVDDTVGLRVEDELAADDFLARVGAQRVDARQVGDRRLRMVANLSVFSVDGDAREVADVLI